MLEGLPVETFDRVNVGDCIIGDFGGIGEVDLLCYDAVLHL